MTGADLRAHRLSAGLTQKALALKAGVTRETVAYWERQAIVRTRWGAPRRFSNVLGLVNIAASNARARGWGLSPWAAIDARLAAQAEAQLVQRNPRGRGLCGAMTRKSAPCQNKSEPGKRRCKFHGGKSTGPRTADGKARIAEAQRRRWAIWRAACDEQRSM